MFSPTFEKEDEHGVKTIYTNNVYYFHWSEEELPYETPKLSLMSEPKQAWSQESKKKRNAWRDQFKFVLWGLRICLRFPYSTNSEGQLETKYISFAFLYWITVFVTYVLITMRTVWAIICNILNEKMDTYQVMIYGYNLVIALYSITYPGSLVKEFGILAESINRWPEFEELCQKCLHTPIQLKHSLMCKVGGIIVVPFSALVIYGVRDLLFCVHWLSYLIKLMIVSSVNYMLLYWMVSVKELSRIGEMINLRISEDLCSLEENSVDASRVRDLRTAWLELTGMIKLNAKSWSYVFLYLAVTLCVIIIMSSFASISILVNENRIDIALLLVTLTASAVSYFMLEYGHRLTHKTGYEICEALGNVNILYMDTAARDEVKFFAKVVKMNYPLVTLGGVFVANRAAMTSLVSAVVTNLIVILQLPNDTGFFVGKTNISNFTNDLYPTITN